MHILPSLITNHEQKKLNHDSRENKPPHHASRKKYRGPSTFEKPNTGADLKKVGGNISLPQIKSFVSVWQKEKFWPTKTSLNVLPAEWKTNISFS